MAFKGNDSCYEKAAEDEPIFTLRAKDRLAPRVVEYWAELARATGSPEEKCLEAHECSKAMLAWQDRNGHKQPD